MEFSKEEIREINEINEMVSPKLLLPNNSHNNTGSNSNSTFISTYSSLSPLSNSLSNSCSSVTTDISSQSSLSLCMNTNRVILLNESQYISPNKNGTISNNSSSSNISPNIRNSLTLSMEQNNCISMPNSPKPLTINSTLRSSTSTLTPSFLLHSPKICSKKYNEPIKPSSINNINLIDNLINEEKIIITSAITTTPVNTNSNNNNNNNINNNKDLDENSFKPISKPTYRFSPNLSMPKSVKSQTLTPKTSKMIQNQLLLSAGSSGSGKLQQPTPLSKSVHSSPQLDSSSVKRLVDFFESPKPLKI